MTSIWKMLKLGDVLKLEYGKPLSKEERDDEGAYPAYGANGVKCRTNKFYWDRPSIIVGRKGSAGEVNLTEKKFWALDVTYFVDFDEKQYDLMFLYYCLKYQNLTSLAKGVKPGINRNDVYAIECAFPPLPEQKRIVVILDKAFAGISLAVANAEKNLANARELFESYLNNIFTQKGDGWKDNRLGDLTVIQSGGTPLKSKSDYWDEGDIAWFSSGELNNMETITPKSKITPEGLNNSNAKLFPKGSLLIGMYDTAALKMSILDRDAAFNQAISGLKPNDGLDLRFVLHAINAIKPEVLKLRRGVRQKNLNLQKIKDIVISVPEFSEQQFVVKKLLVMEKDVSRLETIYQQKLTALNELKQSILQKAFTGELTQREENV
mgnify:CR=1 FL=1